MKLSELDPKGKINLLLIGDSGTGKTVFGTTIPGKIHYCDFDGKVASAAGYLDEHNPAKLADITYDIYTAGAKKGDSGRKFNDDMGKLKEAALKDQFPYDCLIIDSLTTMSDEIMKYLMSMNPGVKRVVTHGAQAPALQDYGIFRLFMKQIIMEILTLPCHVIFTAHIDRSKDETTGRIVEQAMLTGKLAAELPIYFDEVYRTMVDVDKTGKVLYQAQTQSDKTFKCRTQLGLDPVIPLDFNELLK